MDNGGRNRRFLCIAALAGLVACSGWSPAEAQSIRLLSPAGGRKLAQRMRLIPVSSGHAISPDDDPDRVWLTSESIPIDDFGDDAIPVPGVMLPHAGVCNDCDCCSYGPHFGVFAEFLQIRPRDVEVPYAVPVDGPVDDELGNGIQIGETAIVDIDFHSAYRVGGRMALADCRYLVATYSDFEGDTSDSVSIAPPDVVRSLVTHPLGTNTAFDGLDAEASLEIEYDTLDVDFVWMYDQGCNYACGWLVGARYGRLDQEFRSLFEVLGETHVNTNIDFEGAGIRVGALGDWYACHRQFLLYLRANANFLAGEATAEFDQGSGGFDPQVVQTSWESGRVVTILETELGIGWESKSGCLRVNAGYTFSGWLNMVKTDEYISAVQHNDYNEFDNLGDMITFDGLTGRVELRF